MESSSDQSQQEPTFSRFLSTSSGRSNSRSNSTPYLCISKYVLVKVLSYMFDLTTEIKDGTLKMRRVSRKWNDVVIASLEIQKNKDFFRNHQHLNSLSPAILELREELSKILNQTQIQLEIKCKELNSFPSMQQVQTCKNKEVGINMTKKLNELMDHVFLNNRQKQAKFVQCFDQSTQQVYYKVQDIFIAQVVNHSDDNSMGGNVQLLITMNFARLKRLFQYPYLEYQRFLRTKKQILSFVNKIKEIAALQEQLQKDKIPGQTEIVNIFYMIYTNLILNFHDKSILHQQVFKHVMFAKFRALITQISIQFEYATRFYL